MTRRSFVITASGLVATGALPRDVLPMRVRERQAPSGALTAGEVVSRIKAHVGIPWASETVDNIVAGTSETPVKGIATTMMATLDVLQRAAAAGRNMAVTRRTDNSQQAIRSKLSVDPQPVDEVRAAQRLPDS